MTMAGLPFPQDRKWTLTGRSDVLTITDYNWELTGFSPRLRDMNPNVFVYGGNAYFIIHTWAPANGFVVREIPR